MSVVARFYVQKFTKHCYNAAGYAPPAPIIEVQLNPVSGAKGEQNKSWASATPSGNITMTIGNPAAAAWFEERLGKDIACPTCDQPDPSK